VGQGMGSPEHKRIVVVMPTRLSRLAGNAGHRYRRCAVKHPEVPPWSRRLDLFCGLGYTLNLILNISYRVYKYQLKIGLFIEARK
jgi:hypothetical protein